MSSLMPLIMPQAPGAATEPKSGRKFFLSEALVGQTVGLRDVDVDRWLVSFMHVDLGHYDERAKRFEPNDEVVL